MVSLVYSIHSIIFVEPIRLIETCTFSFLGPILRSYSTFNRDIHKIHQPIRLIESILIIETQEYLGTISNYCASGKPKCQQLSYFRFQLLDQICFSWIPFIKMYLMNPKILGAYLGRNQMLQKGVSITFTP